MGHHLPLPHDGDLIGQRHDLLQFVGDDDDRHALVAEAPQDGEEPLRLLRGQNAGRLVKDQNAGAAAQGLDDLHPLLEPDRQILNQRIRVDDQPVMLRHLGDQLARGVFGGSEAEILLRPQHHVLQHRKSLHQHEMLMNHADSVGDGDGGGGHLHLFPVDQDGPAIGGIHPV